VGLGRWLASGPEGLGWATLVYGPVVALAGVAGLVPFRRSLRGGAVLDLVGAGAASALALMTTGAGLATLLGISRLPYVVAALAVPLVVMLELTSGDLIDVRGRLQRLAFASQALLPMCAFAWEAPRSCGVGAVGWLVASALALLAWSDLVRVGRETASGRISFHGTRDVLSPWCLCLAAVLAHPGACQGQGPERVLAGAAALATFRASWALGGPALALFVALMPGPPGREPALWFVAPALMTLAHPDLAARPIAWLWTWTGCLAGLGLLDGRIGAAFAAGTLPALAMTLCAAYRFEWRPLVFSLFQMAGIAVLILLRPAFLDLATGWAPAAGASVPASGPPYEAVLALVALAALAWWGESDKALSTGPTALAVSGLGVFLALLVVRPTQSLGLIALGALVPAAGHLLIWTRPRAAVAAALVLAILCGAYAAGTGSSPSVRFLGAPPAGAREAVP
jgi:hypothetical protein